MKKTIDKFSNFIELYLQYGYLFASIGFSLFLLGYIKNWNWVMEPGGGWMNIVYWERKLENKTVRLIMGVISLISTFSLFLYFEFVSE
ncbi:Imm17 family immunity protein [Aquimarina sp. I32.4]|uniref:Imm17 family immunity protein n=1 Tax=Aquimarina sp. I32.4 TaxID=2053903 RepID=UPI000CDE9194|nr:Imm17 family immunity protein [Aquimarina sp. I32.4]